MGFHNTPGERTIDRLAARNELYRVNVPNGGEAISGPLAGRALQALGGEAMTVDKTIIVNENFDTSNPEDLALYAHEQYHVEQGTGDSDAPTKPVSSAMPTIAARTTSTRLRRSRRARFSAWCCTA